MSNTVPPETIPARMDSAVNPGIGAGLGDTGVVPVWVVASETAEMDVVVVVSVTDRIDSIEVPKCLLLGALSPAKKGGFGASPL